MWVLTIFVVFNNSSAVTTHEYYSYNSCVAAAEANKLALKPEVYRIIQTCTPK